MAKTYTDAEWAELSSTERVDYLTSVYGEAGE